MIRIVRTLLWLALISWAAAVGSAYAGEKRVALVIGNSAYPGMPLPNPVNDARDMAAALRKLGFEVIEKVDATQKEMNRAIAEFGEKLRADTVALFFYAGHGMQVKGKNYLIPIDARIQSESSARIEAVDVDGVLDQLGVSPLNIVILDACRNNPFERRFRSVGGGLAQMDAPKGSLIAYATAPGKTASDGEGRNGLYTREILKHIQTPGLDIEKVFKRVRTGVMAGSGEAQTPWESSSLTGDFYFVPGAAPGQTPQQISTHVPGVSVARTPQQIEDELWDAIKNSRDATDFDDYLKQYPQGRFKALAKQHIKTLTAATPATPAKPALASISVVSGSVGVGEIRTEADYKMRVKKAADTQAVIDAVVAYITSVNFKDFPDVVTMLEDATDQMGKMKGANEKHEAAAAKKDWEQANLWAEQVFQYQVKAADFLVRAKTYLQQNGAKKL